ncbi:MAG: AAA family ATPase [Candidatus Hydrogenedentes bacterium]|nr:AAA family ATPase [Candidatus Hydrogenedentota bacterium]
MRITKLWLDGYGRFSEHVISLEPGMQVILGPNEQGKSTVRNFVTDMLYGQRRGPQLRTFDESNELRRPWNGGERYAGRLTYALDDGREFEIHRNFDKKRGTVAVYDRKHMRDVTAEFERIKGREPSFAEDHLGISKAVFISAATIGPMSLDDLGDDDALAQIREKIVSLADTSDESGTADSALRILNERIGEIGRPVSHSKKPLPLARARLDRLEQELGKGRAAAAEIAALNAQWKRASEQVTTAKRRKESLEEELKSIEQRERAVRLTEAERLQARLDEVTKVCFAHSSLREFPIDQSAEVQRASNALATSKAQAERTTAELADIERQLAEETEKLEAFGIPRLVEIPESTEQELSSLDARIVRLRERSEELSEELARSQERFAQAQRDLQSLPDYSQLGADPIAWLSQLGTSFRVARQSRNSAIEKLQRIREEIARRRDAHAPTAELFATFTDFPSESRDMEVASRVNEERITHLQSEIESLRIEIEERHNAAPHAMWTAVIFGGVALACAGAAIWFEIIYAYLASAFFGSTMAIAIARWFWTKKTIHKTVLGLDRAQEDLTAAERERGAVQDRVDAAISRANVATLRELEGLYERHAREESELASLASAEAQLADEVRDERDRVSHLFARLQETFQSVGQRVAHEDEIEAAAGRAMSHYQEYRDAKRRLGESRDRPAQLRQQLAAIGAELEECQRTEVDRALEVRRALREAGFREEARYTNVLAALQAYHVRTAQVRERLGRVTLMRERKTALTTRLDAEQRDVVKQEEALTARLAPAGVRSVEQWNDFAKRAKVYRDAWDERARLQERIDATLRGETIETLRAAVEKEGAGTGPLSRRADDVKIELRQWAAKLETHSNEERDLHIALTQRTAGLRSLNEIEEEREEVAARVAELELELEATSYAYALIEESARDRHARIAPRIAQAAGQYLGRITRGAYNEIMVSRELGITVRIPQTAKLSEDPRRLLSKGTADQVYLALRLALVRAMSASGESVPLLLDDPFANYDDSRLENALQLLVEIGRDHQILLFTCRQDVARAAQRAGVAVLEI